MSDLETLQRIVDEAGGEGPYMCPCCYTRLPTRDAKSAHLEQAHGYEILRTGPADSVQPQPRRKIARVGDSLEYVDG